MLVKIFIQPLILFLFAAAIFAQAKESDAKAARYLTSADAAQIAGEPMIFRAGENLSEFKEYTAIYFSESNRLIVKIEVNFYASPQKAKAAEKFQRKFYTENGKVSDVTAVGDSATIWTAEDTRAVIVRVGQARFEITAAGEIGERFSADALRKIAERIAAEARDWKFQSGEWKSSK